MSHLLGGLLAWTVFAEPFAHSLYITVRVLISALVLAQLITSARAISFFAWPSFVFLGTISYSLYLWQQLFLVVHQPGWGLLRQFPANLIVPTAVAITSFYLIEKPVLGLKKQWLR